MVQFIKARREGGEKISFSSHGSNQKAIFSTMAAADGSLGRSSEDQQDTAVVVVGRRATLDPKTRDSRITQDHKLYISLYRHPSNPKEWALMKRKGTVF